MPVFGVIRSFYRVAWLIWRITLISGLVGRSQSRPASVLSGKLYYLFMYFTYSQIFLLRFKVDYKQVSNTVGLGLLCQQNSKALLIMEKMAYRDRRQCR